MTTTAFVGTYEAPATETKKPKLGARTYAWVLSKVGPRTRRAIIWAAGLYTAASLLTDILVLPGAAACTAVLIGG